MKKKAQVKFGETIGIIIIVYIVLMLGLLWYNDVNADSLDELYKGDQKSRGFEKYYYITNNHMLREAQQGSIDEEFNLESIHAMNIYSKSKNGNDYLYKFLGYSNVSIKYYDANLENPQVIEIYSNVPDSSNINDEEIFRTLIPIVDKSNNTVLIGVLELINYELKR